MVARRTAGGVAGLPLWPVPPALPRGRGSLAVPWDGGRGVRARLDGKGKTSPSGTWVNLPLLIIGSICVSVVGTHY